MLLKNTSIGDIEVNSDSEKDARAFVEGLFVRKQVTLEGQPDNNHATHRVVVDEHGVRKLERVRFC